MFLLHKVEELTGPQIICHVLWNFISNIMLAPLLKRKLSVVHLQDSLVTNYLLNFQPKWRNG